MCNTTSTPTVTATTTVPSKLTTVTSTEPLATTYALAKDLYAASQDYKLISGISGVAENLVMRVVDLNEVDAQVLSALTKGDGLVSPYVAKTVEVVEPLVQKAIETTVAAKTYAVDTATAVQTLAVDTVITAPMNKVAELKTWSASSGVATTAYVQSKSAEAKEYATGTTDAAKTYVTDTAAYVQEKGAEAKDYAVDTTTAAKTYTIETAAIVRTELEKDVEIVLSAAKDPRGAADKVAAYTIETAAVVKGRVIEEGEKRGYILPAFVETTE